MPQEFVKNRAYFSDKLAPARGGTIPSPRGFATRLRAAERDAGTALPPADPYLLAPVETMKCDKHLTFYEKQLHRMKTFSQLK